MAAMRRNHTGQRQRSNESFTSPTPGSAVRQVACNSFEISNDLENLEPNTSTPVSTLNTATPTSSASSTVSIKASKSKNQGKLNSIGTLINPDDVLLCPLAEKKLNESCHLKGYLKNVKDSRKNMFVLIEHGGHSRPHCVNEHMLLLKKAILYIICYYFDTVGILDHVSASYFFIISILTYFDNRSMRLLHNRTFLEQRLA